MLSVLSFPGAQQFYIYTIDTNGRNQMPDPTLDLPPKYEDVIKDPHLYRTTREVAWNYPEFLR